MKPITHAASASQPDPPTRRELRACLFWCARWLLCGDTFHRGAISVTIAEDAPSCGEHVTFRPRPGEEIYDARCDPRGDRSARLVPRLLSVLVSEEAYEMWRVIAGRGPISAKAVVASSPAERSKAYVLIADLAARGLILETAEGYEIADRELWEAVRSAKQAEG